MFDTEPRKDTGLRVIATARDEQSINKAAKEGFFPLLKPVEPSNEIRSKFAVLQNRTTGEIEVIGDYRAHSRKWPREDVELAIDFTFFYPHSFPSPFAAYLIPKDLAKGEHVLLEDLIEDYVDRRWNQGDAWRLKSCEAIWTGSDFEILYDPRGAAAGVVVG